MGEKNLLIHLWNNIILRDSCNFSFTSLVLLVTVTDEEGLQHVNEEMEAKTVAPFTSDRFQFLL